jgi:NAD(P)-dependent dehydrogenase (short-subunit alcohol dehydrogenase family)
MLLKGTTALITGGGGGIGGGIAEAFVEQGMNVILADIDLGFAQEQATKLGATAMAIALDVASLASWAEARHASIDRFGQVDVLCNNAGISTVPGPIDQFPPHEFERLMAINVTGVYNGIVTFVPDMRARRSGHIVNTSSLNGVIPYATLAAYSASKFAVLGLSDALRDELTPYGVGVSALLPGLTRSRMSLNPKSGAHAAQKSREDLEARMMQPVWLGRAVVKAIESNQRYIMSHPGHKPALEERFRAILDACGEPAQPGYMAQVGATPSQK